VEVAIRAGGAGAQRRLVSDGAAVLGAGVSGNPGGWTVTNIAAGQSGGNSFGSRLAVALAERLSLGYLQVWRDRPIRGVSHPKEFRRLPPLDMLAKPIGATLVIDDVATSGWHMEEPLTALRALGIPAAGIGEGGPHARFRGESSAADDDNAIRLGIHDEEGARGRPDRRSRHFFAFRLRIANGSSC
jgi:hypothetical protein